MQFVIVTSFTVRPQCQNENAANHADERYSSIWTESSFYNEKLSMQRIRCGKVEYE